MKLGATQWKLKWKPPYEPMLDQTAELGLSGVELVAWDRADLHDTYSSVNVASLRGHAEELGLEVFAFVGSPEGLADPDPAKREDAVAFFAEIVEVAKAFGTGVVVSTAPYPFGIPIPWLPPRASAEERRLPDVSRLDWGANWCAYVESAKRCAEFCGNAGLRWAIEPHPFRYISNGASMLRLIEHVDSDALGSNVDPSHLLAAADIPHLVVYQLGDRVFDCHVSDGWSDSNLHVRPGIGQNDWHAFLRALRDVGYDGSLSLELDNLDGTQRGPMSPGTDAATDAEFLAETRLGAEYLREVGRAEGIKFSGAGVGEPRAGAE